MASHLLAISDKKWRYAFYVAPDEAKKRALKIIFDSIASVIVKNQHVQLEAKHRDVFRFYTLDELKTRSWTTMRKTTLLVLAAALCVPAFATAAPVLTAGFSPSDGRPALEIVLGAINNARQSIDVAAYSFTSKPVATALAGANRRGVAVRVVADERRTATATPP